MKSHFKIGVIATVLLTASVAMAATMALVAKQPDPKGGVLYIYSYTCSNGAKGTFSVSAANDGAAQKLAEKQARVVCEEI